MARRVTADVQETALAQEDSAVGGDTPTDPAVQNREMSWLNQHRDEVRARYEGRWIAVVGEEIVADAPDALSLRDRLRSSGYQRPFVTAVPTERGERLHA
jgi:hypothetical protein